MSYSRDNLLSVTAKFADKRTAAIALADTRRRELTEKHPDVEALDRELAKTAMRIFDEISAGSKGIEERIAAVRAENEALQQKRRDLLIKYGYPADYTDVKYECTECKDTGYIGYKMCPCLKKALTAAGYESSGIGRLLDTQSFESFSLDYYPDDVRARMKYNFDFCKSYAEGFDGKSDKNLLLFGGTGLGKTHLTTSMAAVIIERGFDVVYDTAQRIFREFEAEQFRRSEEAYTKKYLDCELLIIDDLGTEMVNQFTVSTLYGIINTRMINGRATVINTNLTSDDMRKSYGDRIVSRLFGEYTVLLFSGRDVRMQKIRGGK